MPQANASFYGSNSITLSAIRVWNALHEQSELELTSAISRGKVTSMINNNYIKKGMDTKRLLSVLLFIIIIINHYYL